MHKHTYTNAHAPAYTHHVHACTCTHTHTRNTGYTCTYGGSSMRKKRRGVKVGNVMLPSSFWCLSSGSETPQPLHRTNVFIFLWHIPLHYSYGAQCPLSQIFLIYCTFQEVRLFLWSIKPCSTKNKLQNLLTSSLTCIWWQTYVVQYSVLRCYIKQFSR
jgi:hypothetical protein